MKYFNDTNDMKASIPSKFVSFKKLALSIVLVITAISKGFSQFPANALVGYHENWRTLLLSQAHANYNVINLAFALPRTTGPNAACRCDIKYDLPLGYASAAAFMAEIDALHAVGKKVLLSLGGATGPIYLANAAHRTIFVNSVNAIMATYSYKIDGIDLDLETTSMTDIPSTWTMSVPDSAQIRMVQAVKSIMANYLANTGKKMLLTMAPEVYYVNGALSSFQIVNSGGKFLPILDGLRNELDMLFMQLYNVPGGVNAWNGTTYYEGTGDFVTSMNETVIRGFTLLSGKGIFTGIPASKIGFGLAANASASTAGSGFVSYTDICNAVRYFKGTIARPAGWTYTLTASYPTLKGLMTWDINEDLLTSSPAWAFANNYTCAFTPAPVSLISFQAQQEFKSVLLSWSTSSELNNDYFSIERSMDGNSFYELARINGQGTTSELSSYSYRDISVDEHTVYYYRLAQYDFDGSVHYSSIVSTQNKNDEGTGLRLSSNPFEESLYVLPYGNNETLHGANLYLANSQGQLIYSIIIDDNNPLEIGSDLAPGLYILTLQSSYLNKQYKVIKK